ncbi:MAG: TRAP transporter permease [Beijerinckiaceae bacterium]|nr:TRAP transporter permease [Beijerinckiaceae bacterium]
MLFLIALCFSAFQLFTAVYAIFPSQIIRAAHVAFLVLVASALIANHRSTGRAGLVFGWAIGIVGFLANIYQWVFYNDLIARAGDLTELDFGVGVVSLVILFVVAWRLLGIALPIVTGIFLAYALFGHLLPAPFDHRPFDIAQIVDQMAFGTEGIYATPTAVSATYIFLFILFGAFLERAGMIQLFNDVAMGAVGQSRGGPAKVAVVSSAFMGMISGSGIANVVTVGQFTIPLMKRFGYKSAFAGGVEATASMGGQIMPPVMGAVAFIMAETLNISYAEVAKAAVIPAFLYFASAFWMVHLEAGRLGLIGLPRDQLPSAMKALKQRWPLLLPLGALIYLLFAGYTPLFAGAVSLALTVVLILAAPVSLKLPDGAARIIFWVVLGIACAGLFRDEFRIGSVKLQGVEVVLIIVLALVLANLAIKGGRETLALCRDSLAEGARQALPVGVACAIVGIVIGTMTLTGIATIFGNWIVSIGEGSLFASLVLTMITCLVLGMGIPTIPTYIITSSLAAPALLKLGVPLLVSHMFVFYFGIIADLTPPVALAAFAAAPIAKESGLKISVQAVRIAMAGFVIPYIAVYDPALMLQTAQGQPLSLVAVAGIFISTLVAIGLWGAASIGYFTRPLGPGARLIAVLAATLIVGSVPLSRFGGMNLDPLILKSAGIAIAIAMLAVNQLAGRPKIAASPTKQSA